MDSVEGVKKRLAYVEKNNLFDGHYINDMKFLLRLHEFSIKYVGDLKKQSNEFRKEAKNERELSESIVAEREQLIIENEELKNQLTKAETVIKNMVSVLPQATGTTEYAQ